MFEWTYTTVGVFHCDLFPGYTPNGPAYHLITASDVNHNQVFNGYLNGTLISASSRNLGFVGGHMWVGAERSNDLDSSYARWVSLKENHLSNGWTPFDNLRALGDIISGHDPDYKFDRETADTGAVIFG